MGKFSRLSYYLIVFQGKREEEGIYILLYHPNMKTLILHMDLDFYYTDLTVKVMSQE